MMRGKVINHYVERDGDREVHIIPSRGVFDVYYVKGYSCLTYMFGIPVYQANEDKYYDIGDAFRIAWNNFSIYEEMIEEEETSDEL